MGKNVNNIDAFIAEVLTRPQQRAVHAMMFRGFSRTEAVRRVINIGILAQTAGLESCLIHGDDSSLLSAMSNMLKKAGR
jgi:hypothetical protein